MRSHLSILRDQRGFALPFGAVAIGAILAFSGLGVGMGQMYTVLSEMQNAADAGALAGAEAMFQGNSPTVEARNVVKSNIYSTETGGASLTDSNIVSVTTGNYDPGTGFQSGISPENAIEVITNETMPPILAGRNMDITARSVAAIQGPEDGGDAPLVIGDCRVPSDCFDDSCMPLLVGVGRNLAQTGWTGRFNSPIRANVLDLFPDNSNCGPPCNGGNDGSVTFSAGDSIQVRDSDDVALLNCVQRCFVNAGITRIELPVVACESLNSVAGSTTPVLGFATFDIVSVSTTTGLTLQGRVPDPGAGGGGGNYYGTGVISLVE